MAKHWSADVCVLCWCDPQSAGRKRMSWGTREWCERLAASMGSDHDPVMYSGFGSRLSIRPSDAPLNKLTGPGSGKKAAKKPRKKKAATTAA